MRKATGQVVARRDKRGTTYAIRFRAPDSDGIRRRGLLTLGSSADGWTLAKAEDELQNYLADVRRGMFVWPAERRGPASVAEGDPTFHRFASEWLAMRKLQGLRPRTIEDYEWALTCHLLPFFADYRLSQITVEAVDRYALAKVQERERLEQERARAKARGESVAKRGLSNAIINKTLTRLSQVLETAVEYGKIPANPASGKRRRLPTTPPRRPWVEPEQLPSLLGAAEGVWGDRARPLVATLVGTGLRVGELLALDRRHVNLARGTIDVADAKTAAGVRTVDLIPALRDELADWLERSQFKQPTDPVFPTLTGRRDNRNNVRKMLNKVVDRANDRLAELGIEPIGHVTPHGLRRTYASLRCAVGDDVAYTAEQLGHEDARFTLRVYTAAVKRRDRLTAAERAEYDRAIEWAQWAQTLGTSGAETDSVSRADNVEEAEAA